MDVFRNGTVFDDALTTDWVRGEDIFVGGDAHLSVYMTISGTAPSSYRMRIERRRKDGSHFVSDCLVHSADGRFDHEEQYVDVIGTRSSAMVSVDVPQWSVIALSACRIGGDATTSLVVTAEAHPPAT